MAHINHIRQYAKQKGISRKRAKEILEKNDTADLILTPIHQHILDRISFQDFEAKFHTMIKQAYDAGEFEQPIFDSLIINPDTPIMNKIALMTMRVGHNGSKERADAMWLWMSSMAELSNQNLSKDEQKDIKASLKQMHDEIVMRCMSEKEAAQ